MAGDSDDDDKEFAQRYGTRTESEEGSIEPKRHAYPTKKVSAASSRPRESIGSLLTREHDAIDITPTGPVRFIGFLLGVAAFLVCGYAGFSLFVLDKSPDNRLSSLTKGIIFVGILTFSALAARWTYLSLTVVYGILRRVFKKA